MNATTPAFTYAISVFVGYLVDMNGTKKRKSRLIMNEDGEEEEELEEDFSHEIPWPSPPPFAGEYIMAYEWDYIWGTL